MLVLDLRPTQHGRSERPSISDSKFIHLLRRCPLVKELNLSGCGAVTDVGLSELMYLHRIKSVNISGCAGITAASLSSICRLRLLERLDISDMHKLSEEDLRRLSRATRLETLISSNVENFRNQTLASVCKSLTRLTTLDISLLRNVSASGLQNLSGLSNLVCLDISGITRVDATSWQTLSQLTKLQTLRVKTILSSSSLTRGFASTVLPALSSLTHLSLGYCYVNGRLSAAISNCSKLVSLQLSNQHKFGLEEFKSFAHLTKLTFSHSTVPVGSLKYLESIQSLNLDFCLTETRLKVSEGPGGELNSKNKSSFSGVRHLTALKQLSLKSCHLDDSMLRSIALASRLETLDVSAISKANLKGIRQIRKLEYLKTVDVSHNNLIDDKVVAGMAPYLSKLEQLFAGNCRDLGDAAADSVSVFCPLLKTIVVFRTKITDEGVRSLVRLKSLLLLDVSSCSSVTASSLYFLRYQSPRCHVNASHLATISEDQPEKVAGHCSIS